MWPFHPSAGAWETVRLKYFRNPHAALCPGSGLYAFFNGDNILGTMGAYPMPITLDGSVHAGHLLADWAVLPQHQYGRAAGSLWNALLGLPGRKFTTIGSRAAQRVFEKRAARIRSGSNAVAVLRPFEVTLLRAQRLEGYAYPSPLLLDQGALPQSVEARLADSFRAPMPYHTSGTAFVVRDREFWDLVCSVRLLDAAIPLNLGSATGEGNVVLRLLEVGRFRYAILLAMQLVPASFENARNVGALLRQALLAMGVAMIRLVDGDELTSEVLRFLSLFVFRREHFWYAIRRPSDTFQLEDVRWWLTNADADSLWGGSQPIAPHS